MSHRGDIAIGSTIDIKFTTRKFTTGAPFALASGVISAYIGNSTTQITAGITLTADFDGVTGLNNVRVVATAANGYAAGTNVSLVITTGTVDSVSVVGEEIGSFSIDNRDTASLGIIDSGTAASATSTTLTLPGGAPHVFGTNVLTGWLQIYGSTQGYWQAVNILSNTSADPCVITFTDAIGVTPTGTILYKIVNGPALSVTSPPLVKVSGTTQTLDALQTAQNSAHGSGSWATATGFATPTNITAGTIATVSGNVNGSVGSVTGAVGSVTGAVGSVTGLTASDVGAIKTKTDQFVFTVANQVDANALSGGGSGLDAAGVRAAIGLASANLDTQLDALPTAVENADAHLDRDMGAGVDSGSPTVRTPRQAFRFLRNKWDIAGDTLTVRKENDSTPSWTADVTSMPGAQPVTSVDPAGP